MVASRFIYTPVEIFRTAPVNGICFEQFYNLFVWLFRLFSLVLLSTGTFDCLTHNSGGDNIAEHVRRFQWL